MKSCSFLLRWSLWFVSVELLGCFFINTTSWTSIRIWGKATNGGTNLSIRIFYFREQSPLFSCKAHVFQVDPDTRKSWIPLSNGSSKWFENLWMIFFSSRIIFFLFHLVNVQIFHDSVKNVYRILSVDGSKVLINTIIGSRISFTKTSQKFCQWVDTRANNVYGLGFSNEADLIRVNWIKVQSKSNVDWLLVYGKISRSKRSGSTCC